MAISIGKMTLKENVILKAKKIVKSIDEQRLVFGFFSVIDINGETVYDLDNDAFDSTAFEKAVYAYVENYSRADAEHNEKPIGKLVESMFFSTEKQIMLGIDLNGVAWWGGFHINDDDAWEKVKKGEYGMFSIGGKGKYLTDGF